MNKERTRLKQELNRLRRQKNILWVGISFLVAVLIWTGLSIFTSQRKVKLDQDLTELAKPIIPRLDSEVLSVIETKRAFSDEELSYFPIYVYLVTENNREGILTNIMDLPVAMEENNLEETVEGEFFTNDESEPSEYQQSATEILDEEI